MSGRTSSRSEPATTASTPRVATVRERLDRVMDPELDRSIVELEYVDRVRVDDGAVEVAFTLPTAWCSPAFAWMMATDARDEVAALAETESVTVRLRDHMHAEGINRGVNERESFDAVFPDADDGVREVRAMLDEKARFARQHDAVEACLGAGVAPEQIVALCRDDVELTDGTAVVAVNDINVTVDREPVAEYLRRARASGRVTDPDDRLFLNVDGEPIAVDRFETVHKRTRLAGVNMGGQGAVCDALNESRRAKLDRD
ncbi:MAG: iron-sulfur cluster assembly protein [Halolamina sp.]